MKCIYSPPEGRALAIIETAAACFSERGFHGTSTNQICAAAGMSPGNLFHYFPNKKAVILAVIEQQMAQTRTLLEELTALEAPLPALSHLFDVLFEVAGEPQQRRLVVEIAAEAGRDPQVQTLVTTSDALLRNTLEQIVGRSRDEASVQHGLSAAQIAGVLMMLVDGLFSRAGADPMFDVESERQALQKTLVALLGARQPA